MLNFIKTQNSELEVLLKRAILFAEDGEIEKANECCEKVLNIEPENAIIYCVKLMIELKVQNIDDVSNYNKPLDDNNNFKKIIRFGSQEIVEKMNEINSNIKQSLYGQAKQLVPTKPKKALKIFEILSDYEDAENYISRCKENIAANKKKNFKRIKKTSIVFAVMILLVITIFKLIIPEINYSKATKLCENGNYVESRDIFNTLGDYKDSKEKYNEATYKYAVDLREKGEMLLSLSEFMKVYSYKDSMDYISKYNDTSYKAPLYRLTKDGKIDVDYYLDDDRSGYAGYYDYIGESDIEKWRDVIAISTYKHHTVGLKKDGTVIARGHKNYRPTYANQRGELLVFDLEFCNYGQCNVDTWTNIMDVQTFPTHTIGLKKDGTVVATGDNKHGRCDVEDWINIVAIYALNKHTIGLKKDGTVVAAGNNAYGRCNVEDWTNIVAVYARNDHTIGLKKDGTVVVTGDNKHGQCNVENWTNIIDIQVLDTHTIGLKKDGTVVATGDNKHSQCNVEDWNDIVVISSTRTCTIGLKKDGTVVGTGKYNKEIENWKDIVAIDSADSQIIGLKKDGTVVAVGNNGGEKHNVSKFKEVVAVATSGDISYIQQKDGTVIETGIEGHYNVRYNNKLPTLK